MLQYPRPSDPVNHIFFDAFPQVDISRVTHFVNQQCGFMEAFDHVLGRYGKTTVDTRLLTACLIAWGTNMGLGKMGSISDIGYQVLAGISENFIRLETLKTANDRISNATSTLSIFRHYDINEAVHSSSDGQKFETRIHTLRSRYPSKYFGLKKGVSSYTLTANHVPVNATIFGANEHESHYVFDLLYNNTTDIQPSIHSTDTHGTNQVNFAVLHFFGHQFAPRYANIYETVSKSLYAFHHPNQYEGGQLRPIRKIRERLIIDEWENIQRIIVSLARKVTTQSIIISKLSAHARKNKTKQALWEYDNIIRSLYLLDYVDSPPLRRHIQKALNRTESYHKLRRAIAIANGGKLRFRTQPEQEIWNECSRLIANCIIHYNAAILSNMLDQYESATDTESTEWIKQISPVAWQHVNLYGRYEFQKTPDPINLEDMISQLSHLNPTP
ncbi:MAG: TnpA family transposase [Neolewinella sp.]